MSWNRPALSALPAAGLTSMLKSVFPEGGGVNRSVVNSKGTATLLLGVTIVPPSVITAEVLSRARGSSGSQSMAMTRRLRFDFERTGPGPATRSAFRTSVIGSSAPLEVVLERL
jgi:hypothetical protein